MSPADATAGAAPGEGPLIGMVGGSDAHRGQRWSSTIEVDNTGSTDVYRLGGLPGSNGRVLHITSGYLRQPRRHVLEDYDLIFNTVTDADQNGKVLAVLARVLRDYNGPVINPPEAVARTTREAVAKRLAGIPGLIVPRVRTVKSVKPVILAALERAGEIEFPSIARLTGTHGGKVIGIVDNVEALADAPRSAASYTLTRFVDFRSRDGLYRKFRVFFFGGKPVFRHMLVSDRWNVHMADRDRFMKHHPRLIAESQSLYERGIANFPPRVRATLQAIDDRLGLDFMGVDFGLLPNWDVVLFEANATMNFFPISKDPALAAMTLCVPPAQRAFAEMLAKKSARRRSA